MVKNPQTVTRRIRAEPPIFCLCSFGPENTGVQDRAEQKGKTNPMFS